MKKLLALVLALVMTLSLATVSSNAAFKDADKIDETYAEAAAVLAGMGVFKGYTDGSFNPKGDITRAEVAAIIYRVYTADVKDSKASLYASYNKFSDMAGAGWAAGYIGYCANAAFVKGYPDGTFKPLGKVTGYEVLAMILRAVGYDQNNEFTGADWALHVAQYAQQLKILDNVKGVDLNAAATRELVAELLFRTIDKAPQVTYTPALNYNQYTTIGGKELNKTLGEDNFDLEDKDTKDEFGRPTVTWSYNTGDRQTVIAIAPIVSYTEATKNCDIYADSGLKKGAKLDVYTNSDKAVEDGYTIADNTTKYGAQGRLTEIYEDRVVNIDTYLAKVTKAVAEKTDSKGHVDAAYVEVNVFDAKDYVKTFETDEFAKGDFVLVTIADGDIQSMVKAESKNAALTKVAGNSRTIYDIQDVMGLDKADVTVNHTAKVHAPDTMVLGSTYNFYFDTYDNVIGADELSTNYAVLDNLYLKNNDEGVETANGTVYFFGGESEKVVFDKVYNYTKDKMNDEADFESTSKKNADYYHAVYTYTVDKDGEYTLGKAVSLKDFAHVESDKDSDGEYLYTVGEYRNSSKYMRVWDKDGNVTNLQLSKNTQILLQTKDSPNGTITPYTGYEKLPNFESSNVWYKLDSLGYVSMLYAQAAEFTSRTVFIYDTTPSYSWVDEDHDIATMDVLELVKGEDGTYEWKDTTVDIYFGADPASVTHVDNIGLYEITEGTNGAWYAIEKYEAHSIQKITDDGMRVKIDGHYEDLDDAKIVKYTGTSAAGTVNYKTWTQEDLIADGNAFGYVQYDEDGNVLAVYDLFIKQTVKVDGEKTADVEYWGRDFNTIKVALEEHEMIDTAVMNGTSNVNLITAGTVKYFDKAGKEIKNFDSDKGTKVAYAEISYANLVRGDVTITTADQAAYTNSDLVDETYTFDVGTQTATVHNYVATDDDKIDGIDGTITVNKAGKTVSAGDLADLLTKEALGTNYQSVKGVYNTQAIDSSKVDADEELETDMFVQVKAWNGDISVYIVKLG